MAFEGNVKDFGLSEIFQLISLQKKSGMLSVTGEKSVVVFFQDGEIISTRDRRNRTRDPLKDYMLRYGFIGRDEMNNLQQIQSETKLDLTDILLSEKYFSEDELTIIFNEQIQETIQEVLSWPKSYYKFIIGNHVLQGIRSFASIKVEGLLMESMRRIDEFPELQRIFPVNDMVLRRLEISAGTDPKLGGHEEYVYELLENEMSLEELISHARMARFCTYESLKNLLEKQLLEIVRESRSCDEAAEEDVAVADTGGERRFVPTLAVILLLLACFAVGEYAVPFLLPPGWNAGSGAPKGQIQYETDSRLSASLRELKVRHVEASVREGLEEYFAAKGSYPFTLEILAVSKFVPQAIIENAHQSGLIYCMEKNGASYSMKRS